MAPRILDSLRELHEAKRRTTAGDLQTIVNSTLDLLQHLLRDGNGKEGKAITGM